MLVGGAEVAGTARELADRETPCCSFFTFTVRAEDETVRVRVEVPPDHSDALTAVAARAVAAVARNDRG